MEQQRNKPVEVNVYAVGVDSKGRTVVRAMLNGSRFDIPTDTVTFARLAAAGVRVVNGD